jgi:hypothetical protein
MTQHNLGTAYQELPRGDRGANLRQAITCYQAALRVQTHETLPFDCLATLASVSGLHYHEQEWPEALQSTDEGLRVLESIRGIALTAAERTRVLSEHAVLFDRAVVSAVELRQYAHALMYAERGKTRNLIDALTRRDVRPWGVTDEEWRMYLDRVANAESLERQLASGNMHEPDAAQRYQRTRDDLLQVRQDLERLESQFRATDPDYLATAPPLTFADIREAVQQANAVLVEFRVTEAGTFVFLLGGDDRDVIDEQVVRVPEFISGVLQEMLVKFVDGEPVDGWLVKYYQWREQPRARVMRQEWMDCLDRITGELYVRLLRPVYERLRTLYPKTTRLILVPNKGLNLLPLHAAHDGANGQRRYWLDDYEVLYTPSCAVLRRCLQREEGRGGRDALFAVQNPSGNLAFADWDVEGAAPYFRLQHILPGAQATVAEVKRLIVEGHEVLLSCHGFFNLNDVFTSHLVLHGDERLMLSDILQLDLSNAWLVVLSACETAVSDFWDVVDEVQGLHTAFLIARAPTVVGSL